MYKQWRSHTLLVTEINQFAVLDKCVMKRKPLENMCNGRCVKCTLLSEIFPSASLLGKKSNEHFGTVKLIFRAILHRASSWL